MIVDNEDNDVKISLFRLLILLLCIVGGFFGFSAILCFTNESCKQHIPSIHNLFNSPYTIPYIVSALNTMLSIHGILVVAVYAKTKTRSAIGSKVQILSALSLYISLCISLFVFPISLDNINYTSILILLSISIWMLSILLSLKDLYNGNMDPKRKYLLHVLIVFFMYNIFAIIYMGLAFSYQNEIWVLFSEILCGLSILLYIILIFYHVGNMTIKISS